MEEQKLKNDKNKIRKFKDPLSPAHLAKQILVRGENKRDFFDLVLKIREETHTHTRIEQELLKKYIFSVWKLRRMREVERRLLNTQNELPDYGPRDIELFNGKRGTIRVRNINRIDINEEIKSLITEQEKLEKGMIKALRQLRDEQKLRAQLKDG